MNNPHEILDDDLNSILDEEGFEPDGSLSGQEESPFNESNDVLNNNEGDENTSIMENQENSGQEIYDFSYSPEQVTATTMEHSDSSCEVPEHSEWLNQAPNEQAGDSTPDSQGSQSENIKPGVENTSKKHPSFGSDMKHLYCSVCGHVWYSPKWDSYCPKCGAYDPKPM